jgi:hypothetical protein
MANTTAAPTMMPPAKPDHRVSTTLRVNAPMLRAMKIAAVNQIAVTMIWQRKPLPWCWRATRLRSRREAAPPAQELLLTPRRRSSGAVDVPLTRA